MKRLLPIISFALGMLGTFASIFEIPAGPLRSVCLIVFSLLTCGGLVCLLSQRIDWLSVLSNLSQLRHLGIMRVYRAGVRSADPEIATAKTIRIMAVSANALIKKRKDEIVSALREHRAFVRVLLAQPGSQFVLDVEEAESPHRLGQISPEICGVERLLSEYVEEALSGKRVEEIGRVEIGYYTTHLRSSLILCNESWGWLTLILPPKRALQSVSFELCRTDNGLLEDCIEHFDRCWEIAEQRGQARRVLPRLGDHSVE